MRRNRFATPILIALALCSPLRAAGDEFDQLARELETGEASAPAGEAVGAGAATPSAMNPEISLVLDVAAAWFSSDENGQTGAHDPTTTGFNFQQLELAVRAPVDPYFRFDAYLVFGLFGVELEEAYGTTLALPAGLQARFGQFLTRFGRINATHPHAWDFADQPLAIGRVFGAEGSRGLGAELSWLLPLPWSVEWAVSASGAAGAGTNRSFYGGDDLGVRGPADLLYISALKQFFELSSDWSALWGLSGAFGPNSSGRANRTEVYGTDFFLKYRPIRTASTSEVRWQTELVHRRRQVPDAVLTDVNAYSQLAWRFSRRWVSAGRYEYGSPVWDLDGRRAADPLDPDWVDARHRVAIALTHYPTEFSRLRLQTSSDLPGDSDPIWSAFLTAELVVGAHSAHAF